MTLAYDPRLLCLCLAAFFLVHLAWGAAVVWLTPAAVRLAGRMRASHAARFLLALRMSPVVLAAMAVLLLCAPSYLLLETPGTQEEVGAECLVAAAAGAAMWCLSGMRAMRALRRLNGWVRGLARASREERLEAGAEAPVLVVDTADPLLAIVGVVRPRLMVSRTIVQGLPAEELMAAVRHERAHAAQGDNLKRLAMLASPGLLPGWSGFETLERAWSRSVEWAADDSAAAGDAERRVSLAAALVHVARMGRTPAISPLATALLADGDDLAVRVERLLRGGESPRGNGWWSAAATASAAGLMGGAVLWMSQGGALYWAHRMLEKLAH